MHTNNYFKIRRAGMSKAEHVFFDGSDLTSIAGARRLAESYAAAVEKFDLLSNPESESPVISVWQHGAPGTGHLPCVGGCDICAPHTVDEEDENEPAA